MSVRSANRAARSETGVHRSSSRTSRGEADDSPASCGCTLLAIPAYGHLDGHLPGPVGRNGTRATDRPPDPAEQTAEKTLDIPVNDLLLPVRCWHARSLAFDESGEQKRRLTSAHSAVLRGMPLSAGANPRDAIPILLCVVTLEGPQRTTFVRRFKGRCVRHEGASVGPVFVRALRNGHQRLYLSGVLLVHRCRRIVDRTQA